MSKFVFVATVASPSPIAANPVGAQNFAKPTSGQRLEEATASDVPDCARKPGTLSIVDADTSSVTGAWNLAPPSKLLKVPVQRSGCGGFFAVAGAVGRSYDNTDIGRIVTLSPIQAYSKLVSGVGLVTLGAAGTAEAAPAKRFAPQGEVAPCRGCSSFGRGWRCRKLPFPLDC
ncbi:hypothetical protein [Sphingomonas sp. Marseille-Q8236]